MFYSFRLDVDLDVTFLSSSDNSSGEYFLSNAALGSLRDLIMQTMSSPFFKKFNEKHTDTDYRNSLGTDKNML